MSDETNNDHHCGLWCMIDRFLYAGIIALAVIAMTVLAFVWMGQRDHLIHTDDKLTANQAQIKKVQAQIKANGKEARETRDKQIVLLKKGLIAVCVSDRKTLQSLLDLSTILARTTPRKELKARLAPYYAASDPKACKSLDLPRLG